MVMILERKELKKKHSVGCSILSIWLEERQRGLCVCVYDFPLDQNWQ